jgi:hypothetical protein
MVKEPQISETGESELIVIYFLIRIFHPNRVWETV